MDSRVSLSRTIRAHLASLALLFGATALALCLGEAALRVAGLDWTASMTTGDRLLGWSHRPGATGWFLEEGRAFVRINSAGMRDVERSVVKPPRAIRIVVLGDSTTESWQVELDRAWPHLVEKHLSDCARLEGRPVEVLNFGVSGYGTAQELILLRSRVWKYSPDIVLLAFFPGNDLYNNVQALNPTNPDHAPYFVFRNGELVQDDSFLANPELDAAYIAQRNFAGEIMNRSRLLRGMYAAYLELGKRAAVRDSAVSETPLYLKPPVAGTDLDDAWRVTEELIRVVNDETHAVGADLWMTSMTTGEQVHPDPAAREERARELEVMDLDYPNRRIERLAVRESISYIDQLEPLRATAERIGQPLHGFKENGRLNDGHLNELGHAAVADVIAGELCQRMIVSTEGPRVADRD